jgi:hypothetical protein
LNQLKLKLKLNKLYQSLKSNLFFLNLLIEIKNKIFFLRPKEVVAVPESVPIIQTIIEEPAQKQVPETPKQEPILNVDAPVVSLQEKAPVEPALDLDWKKTLKRHELQQEATIDGRL